MNHTLRKRIMRRVWALYLWRKATSPVAVQTYVLSFFVYQLFLYVSMAHVVANMPSMLRPAAFVEFYFNSFVNTELLVQMIAVGVLSLGSWLIRSITRNVRAGSLARHAFAKS